jgi:hypothetical protein
MPSTEVNNATMSTKIRAEEELSSCLCCVTKTSPPRNSSEAVVVYDARLFWERDVGWCRCLVRTSSKTKPNPLRSIHQKLKELPKNKKIEHKGERTRWRSALARKKEREPAKWWYGRPLTTSTKWKGGDDNYNDEGATRLQGGDVDYDDNDEAAAAAAATRDLREDYCPVTVIPPNDRVRTITTTTAKTSRRPPPAITSRCQPPGETARR